jgi:hypothetical protein
MSAAPASDLPDHVSRYLARVDAHLPTLSIETRREFLSNEAFKWMDRYREFQVRVAHDMPTSPEVDAADFILTIAELDLRIAAQIQKVAA